MNEQGFARRLEAFGLLLTLYCEPLLTPEDIRATLRHAECFKRLPPALHNQFVAVNHQVVIG